MLNKKMGAFTLAEVLITLGIIGVVAAMTIPNLIANTRSQQYRSKYKKVVSTLSQAARLSDSLYGYDFAGITQKCGSDPASEHPDNVMTVCAILNGTLSGATYLGKGSSLTMRVGNTTKTYSAITSSEIFTTAGLNLSKANVYALADGSYVFLSDNFGRSSCSKAIGTVLKEVYSVSDGLDGCLGIIDVNGAALPNKEVSCSSGTNKFSAKNCIVKNDAAHMTDIFPIRFHDGIVEPATAAAAYVLNSAK